jgi:hypothetical protein
MLLDLEHETEKHTASCCTRFGRREIALVLEVSQSNGQIVKLPNGTAEVVGSSCSIDTQS